LYNLFHSLGVVFDVRYGVDVVSVSLAHGSLFFYFSLLFFSLSCAYLIFLYILLVQRVGVIFIFTILIYVLNLKIKT
jgi:hypothetical protein